MPNIDVFLRDDNHDLASYTTDDISAALDDSSLYVESLKPSEQGIFYIFMLDVSSSVQLVYLNAAKQAVLDTYDSLRPQDRLAVIAFGEEV